MGFQLRPGLHFCQSGSAFIFLDLVNDRYFRLPEALENAFGNLVDDPFSGGSASAPLIDAGILQASSFRQALSRPRLTPAVAGWHGLPGSDRSLLEVGRAVSAEIWIAQNLRVGRLASLIATYVQSKTGRALSASIDDAEPRRVACAFELAKLVRSPANRCLPRSLAMARRLTACHCDAYLVIGVRADPFTAHCWVQSGDIVLNDTPDEVSRYTPIFLA